MGDLFRGEGLHDEDFQGEKESWPVVSEELLARSTHQARLRVKETETSSSKIITVSERPTWVMKIQ